MAGGEARCGDGDLTSKAVKSSFADIAIVENEALCATTRQCSSRSHQPKGPTESRDADFAWP